MQLWDLSSMSSTASIPNTHKLPLRSVSWAPNNEHRFVTGGEDGKLRFWDTRCVSALLAWRLVLGTTAGVCVCGAGPLPLLCSCLACAVSSHFAACCQRSSNVSNMLPTLCGHCLLPVMLPQAAA